MKNNVPPPEDHPASWQLLADEALRELGGMLNLIGFGTATTDNPEAIIDAPQMELVANTGLIRVWRLSPAGPEYLVLIRAETTCRFALFRDVPSSDQILAATWLAELGALTLVASTHWADQLAA